MRSQLLPSLLLACLPLCANAGEDQLLEHEAPLSANSARRPETVLQRLVDLPLHPTRALNLRTYGFGIDGGSAPIHHTWATGGRIGVTLPEWHDWLSVGGAAYASFPVSDTDTPNRTRLVSSDDRRLLVGGES